MILYNVGTWYKHHGLARMRSNRAHEDHGLPRGKVVTSIAILLLLIFSKYFYLASITSYYTFYLIHTFHVSVQQAQVHLFIFLAAVAAGTLAGGPLGDKFGRKYVIWFSILGILPFTLVLPYANLFWTSVLSVIIGMVMASAFPAIVVYAQELLPGRVGMISGLFFGFSFGMGGIGAAVLGWLADLTDIVFVYKVCAFLPAIGLAHRVPAQYRQSQAGAYAGGGSGAVTIQDVAKKYAVAVSPTIRALIDPADPADPIARQFLPDIAELIETAGGAAPIPSPTRRIRRSKASCIAIPTACCSRRCRAARSIAASVSAARWWGRERPMRLSPADLAAALAYIQSHPEIWEVILTGGDPFILSPRRMAPDHPGAGRIPGM